MPHPSPLCTFVIWLGFNDDPFDMELSVLPFTQCTTLEVHDIRSA